MKIAIFGNAYKKEIKELIDFLIDFFSDKNACLLFEKDLFQHAKACKKYNSDFIQLLENEDFEADIAFSIGGDGTFLNTAALVGNKEIPILGINMGRLGFLADVAGDNILPALEAIISSNYIVEDRSVLYVSSLDETVLEKPYALNDVVILKQDSSSMISVDLTVNNEFVNSYQGDGLIIATPTGSTAYSMSVGGPIAVPQSENFILSPVASHSLSVRPLIIPDSWEIELTVKSRSHSYLVAFDGRSKVLKEETKLRIKKADYTIKVIKQPGYTFFDTLKNKLMWGVDKRN